MKETIIGNWVIEHKLGDGGMGAVYLARHKTTGAPAAVKALFPSQVHEPQAFELFEQEATTQMRLRHPHIAQALDYQEKDGQYYLVMEYLDGHSLSEVIERQKGAIEIKTALTWIKQALRALDYAHQQGVIHRDLKPSNLLLDQHGQVKVADFGIALVMGGKRLTETGMTKGTPEYMSPEQIVRPKEMDHRTDVYSMGIVLYELLTGRVPFEGRSEFEVKEAQVKKSPPSLRQFNPNLPTRLERIVLRALEKDPAKRYGGCGEFARAIEAWERETELSPPAPSSKSWKYVLGALVGAVLLSLVYFAWPTQVTMDRYYDLREEADRQQGPEAAEKTYREKVEKEPRQALWQGLLAWSYEEQDKLKEAEAALQKATELEPKEALWEYMLGIIKYREGNKTEAQSACQRAASLAPDEADRHLYLGSSSYCLGNWTEAETNYREAIKLKPKRPWPYSFLASALRAQKKWAEAETQYHEALRLTPKTARYHEGLGVTLDNQQKSGEAISAFQKAAQLAPKNARYRYALGNSFYAQKKWSESEAAFSEATRLAPERASYQDDLGNALFAQKKWPDSETAYRKAVALKPDNGDYQGHLGGALWEQKKYAEAATAYREAARLSPQNDFYVNRLGRCRWEQGDWPGAAEAFRAAVNLKPNEAAYHNNLGLALEKQFLLWLAADEFQKAMNLAPENQDYRRSYERVSRWPRF